MADNVFRGGVDKSRGYRKKRNKNKGLRWVVVAYPSAKFLTKALIFKAFFSSEKINLSKNIPT